MKIFSAAQTRALDQFTIEHEPIASLDLMERASLTFVHWFTEKFPNNDIPIFIFCGLGNNGGDGSAIARLLHERFYEVKIFICEIGKNKSSDFQKNFNRLPPHSITPFFLEKNNAFPKVPKQAILMDAIFGSGLNRSVEGYWGNLLEYLNQLPNKTIVVDVPSGMFADQHTAGISIEADFTFSFEMPKLAFFFPENEKRVGAWDFESIGLSKEFISNNVSTNFYLDKKFVQPILRQRKKYAHKGTFGHALLIVGSHGKVGAAILATQAALRSGAGLVSAHVPKCAYSILQIAVPEAMVSVDEQELYFSKIENFKKYNAIGMGCGWGTEAVTAEALFFILKNTNQPLVLDADALNIISKNKNWLERIPPNSILTPHPKEFERLFGAIKNDFERNEVQRNFSKKLEVYIILKGAHTCISTPEGHCYFNSTGNPGMATAGSGDVLTGILTGLLSQKYNSLETSILGVFLQGLAGDLAIQKKQSEESLIAGDLVDFLGAAFHFLQKKEFL